jgi:pyrimidine-specific ribonucleoside hydrolase
LERHDAERLAEMADRTPLVVDCDPGIDDAVALALAVASPEVDLRAVTTLAGNAPVDATTRNAVRLLRAFGRPDIPVTAGATRSLVRVGRHGLPSPHGANGLGGVELAGPDGAAEQEHAVDRLARLLLDAPARSVTIAAIGPLTNIALLLALHPESAAHIDRVVVMGGSTGAGNITDAAEFNVWTDPEAAQRVLADSDLNVCLVGLDVTRRATVDERHLDVMRRASPAGRLAAAMLRGYGDAGPKGWPLHDVLALAAVIDPTLLETRRARVEVDTGLGAERGRTRCAFDEQWQDTPSMRCDVASDVDVGRFRALLLDRLAPCD